MQPDKTLAVIVDFDQALITLFAATRRHKRLNLLKTKRVKVMNKRLRSDVITPVQIWLSL